MISCVWSFEKELAADVNARAAYVANRGGLAEASGAAVALDGDTLAVGAPQERSIAHGINGNQNDDDERETTTERRRRPGGDDREATTERRRLRDDEDDRERTTERRRRRRDEN